MQTQLKKTDNLTSFSEITNEWLDCYSPQWKMSSRVKYENIINLHLHPWFGDSDIQGISRIDVVRFSEFLLTQGRTGTTQHGLAPKTVTDILSVLRSIFKYASQIKKCSVTDIGDLYIKRHQEPMRVLSQTEQQILISYLYHHVSPCNLGILLCIYTGLRIGELCALKWGDICFDGHYIYVHQTMQRLQIPDSTEKKTSVILSSPKSDCSIRKIPIPDSIFDILKSQRKEDSAFFLSGQAQKFVEPRTMQNHFKQILQNCDIAPANFHTLRHTFATRCVELGFDIKSLSEILGHASVNITLNRYVHPSMELKQENMNRLELLQP